MISCQNRTLGAPGQPLTPALNMNLAKGSLTVVIGINGCGAAKSAFGKISTGCSTPGSVAFMDRQLPVSLQELELVAAGFWDKKQTAQQ